MASKHHEAVRVRAHQFRSRSNTRKVYAHRVAKFDDPEVRVGKENYIPDIVVEFTNGRVKMIEVDTGSPPLTGQEKKQSDAFKRSVARKGNWSYDHEWADDIL